MPKGKEYKAGSVGTGGSKTPASVMGSQGSSANIPVSQNQSKSTKRSSFPGSFATKKPAGKLQNHK